MRPFKKSANTERFSYTPPRSYWKEIGRLDEQIYDLSEHIRIDMYGRTRVALNHALWSGVDSEKDPLLYWKGHRMLPGPVVLSTLYMGDFVRVDPVAEGMPSIDGSSSVQTGVFVEVDTYSSPRRSLSVTHDYINDASNPVLPQETSEIRDLNLKIGGDAVSKHDYDKLIAELERGASGYFSIPVPPTE